jgi:tmRNA-binding protein
MRVSYLACVPNQVRYKNWELRVLLRIGGGLKDYDRRRRIIANPPKPMARSEKADGQKLLRTIYAEESLVVFSYVLLQLV